VRVLVTRPQPGAARTAEWLSRLGHDAVLMPLFEAAVTARLDDLPPVADISGLIATSARAFDMFEDMDVAAAGLADVRVHAVGAATAQAARDAGFEHVHEAGGTAQALAQDLTGDQVGSLTGSRGSNRSDRRARLVYLAGVPRTPLIEVALKAHDTDLTVVECYKMSEISYSTDILKSDILSPVPDVILLYSANAARRIRALTDVKNVSNTLEFSRFLCLSASIAGELPQEWQSRVIVAGRPDEDSLLVSLAKLD
jgi:uroporphyrinogen-III synthase